MTRVIAEWECLRCGVDCRTREGFLEHYRIQHAIHIAPDGSVEHEDADAIASFDRDGFTLYPNGRPLDRFLSPAEQRRLLDRDAGPLWVVVLVASAATALLVGWAYWAG